MKSPESQSADEAHPGSLQGMEKELFKEALVQRLIHPGVPLDALYPGAHAALRGYPLTAHPHPVTSMARPPQDKMIGAPISNQEMAVINQNQY